MTNDDKKSSKTIKSYDCKICDYNTCKKTNYEKHLNTIKHSRLQINDKSLQNSYKPLSKVATSLLVCNCGKEFKFRQNLWTHRKKCIYKEMSKIEIEEVSKNDLIKQLLLQNQQLIFENKEFKELMMEQSNKMLELATKPHTINNTHTHTNSHNQQFNLNLFLNEKCKNAMNMSDFIDTIKIMDNDFEDMGKLGYVQGISNILIKSLRDLDETIRPLHCSDIKRETIYIKDNDTWDKDDNKDKIKKTIASISNKNVKYIPIWRDANPTALDGTTKKNDEYMKIANQIMTSITPDDQSGINKIIRNVANSVTIDKENALYIPL